jgi:hypothetical protein
MEQFVGQQRIAGIGGQQMASALQKERFVTTSEIFFLPTQNPAE